MQNKFLWLAVTNDKYELPLIVEDTAEKLGEKLGLKKNTVSRQVYRNAKNPYKGRKIVKVEI